MSNRQFVCLGIAASLLLIGTTGTTAPAPRTHRVMSPRGPTSVGWPKVHLDDANQGYNASESIIGTANVSTLTQTWSTWVGAVHGAMALNSGTVYTVGATDHGSTQVSAVDASTGVVVWHNGFQGAGIGGLAYDSGSVFFSADGFYSLDAATGAVNWHAPSGGLPGDPTIAGGLVYFGATDGRLHALDETTGTEIWSYNDNDAVGTGTPPVVDGVVYAAADDGSLFALDAQTGVLIWRYQMGGAVCCASMAVSGGVVYVAAQDVFLYAVDAATGTRRWKSRVGKLYPDPRSPSAANGVVYAASNGYAQAFSASNGHRLWKTHIGDGTQSPILANGVVYIPGSVEGSLWALDAAT